MKALRSKVCEYENETVFFSPAAGAWERTRTKLNFFQPFSLSLKRMSSMRHLPELTSATGTEGIGRSKTEFFPAPLRADEDNLLTSSDRYRRNTPGEGTPWQIKSSVRRFVYSLPRKCRKPAIWQGVPVNNTSRPWRRKVSAWR